MKYKIDEGRHYSRGAIWRIFNYIKIPTHIHGEFKFSDKCWYPKKMVEHTGINKLFGVSYGIFGVHENSIRIGWQPDWSKEGMIRIYAYYYTRGKGHYDIFLLDVPVNKTIYFKLFAKKRTIYLTVGGQTYIQQNIPKPPIPIGHLHYPYFGGKSRSPQDMHINLKYRIL